MERIETLNGLAETPTSTKHLNVSRSLSGVHTLTTLIVMADDLACNGYEASQGPIGIVADTKGTDHMETLDALITLCEKISAKGIEIQGIAYTKAETLDALNVVKREIDVGKNPSGFRCAYGNRRIYAIILLIALNVDFSAPVLAYDSDEEADKANIRENGSEATTKPLTIQDRVHTAVALLTQGSPQMAELRRIMGITHGMSQVIYHAGRACKRHKFLRSLLEEGKLAIPAKYEAWKKLADMTTKEAKESWDAPKETAKKPLTSTAVQSVADNASNPYAEQLLRAITSGDKDGLHDLANKCTKPVQVQTALDVLEPISDKSSKSDMLQAITVACDALKTV